MYLFISGSDSQRIESGDAIAEELAYVVIVRYIAFCTPACRTAIFVPAVCILEFGGTDGVTYGQVGGECNALQSGLSLFSGDQNDAISCLRTIKRGGRRTFQAVDAFYVVRIQVGNPVTGITVQSIVVTADYGGGGFCLSLIHI